MAGDYLYPVGLRVRLGTDDTVYRIVARHMVPRYILAVYAESLVEAPDGRLTWENEADIWPSD
jgi:hypothetical protein